MFKSLPIEKIGFLLLLILSVFFPSAEAQNLSNLYSTGYIANGFDRATPFRTPGEEEDFSLFEGFSLGVGISSSYNSNVRLNSSGESRTENFSISTGATISYRTAADGGARIVGTLTYSPSYNISLGDSDLSSFNQSLRAGLNYGGDSVSAGVSLGYSRGSSSNRLARTFTESDRLNFGANISYNYSPKTSLRASWGHSREGFTSSNLNGGNTNSFGLSGSWQATPLIRIGPSFSYSISESDSAGDRKSFGAGLSGSYELSGKTSISASLGLSSQDFSDSSFSDDVVLTGSLNASWTPDDLWSLSAGLSYRTVPSPALVNFFVNNYDFDLTVSRSVGIGRMSWRLGYSFSDFVQTGEVAQAVEDEHFFSTNISYSRPIFGERIGWSSSIGYQKNFGDFGFSGYTINTSLSYSF